MFVSRVLAVLLTTDVCFQQFKYSSSMVIAFRNSSPLSALRSAKIDENSEHLLLLDESIMLYSRLKTKYENGDLQTQRKNDLTSLIEDVVLDGSGIVRDEVTDEGEKGQERENDNNQENATKEPSSLDEISRALDEQILLGSQTTFSEEELNEWIEKIDSLHERLQTHLVALPPVAPNATTTLKSTTPPAPIDRLRSRLESMRT